MKRYRKDLFEYCLMAGMVAMAFVGATPALGATGNNVFLQIGAIVTANVG